MISLNLNVKMNQTQWTNHMQKQNQLKRTDESESYHYFSTATSYSDVNGLAHRKKSIW
jgi:hypothetical protein